MSALARIARPDHPAPDRARTGFRPHRPADRGARLAHALAADAARAGCAVTLTVVTVEPWSSATFNGSVILLSLAASPGAALSHWLAALSEQDVPLGRDIVADLAVEPQGDGWQIRALLCLDAANG